MGLRNRIVGFLESLPNIESENSRRALIAIAELDENLRNLIEFEGPVMQFCSLLVETLERFGVLSDGRDARVAILEAASNMVGQEGQAVCNSLIDQLNGKPLPYELVRPQEFDLDELVDQFSKSFRDTPGLIGFAVPYTSHEFLDNFCNRLKDEYRPERMDRYGGILAIDPVMPVDWTLKTIKKEKEVLKKNDMLFGVKIDIPHKAQEFWQCLCQEFKKEMFEHRLVVILAVGPDCSLPEEVIKLNSPRFARAHVRKWVVNVIKSISRQGETNLGNTVRGCIESFYKECCFENDGELNIELVYAHLKKMGDFLKTNPSRTEFLQRILER